MQIIFLAIIAVALLSAADAHLFPSAPKERDRRTGGRRNPRRITPRRRRARPTSGRTRATRPTSRPNGSPVAARWWWE